MRAPLYTSLDDALAEIGAYGTELENGNSNHAPMVVEALCALGHPEAVAPWLARYRARMRPRPPVGEPVRGDDWQAALGHRERFADWAELFADELAETAWPAVLDRWVERLAPGFCAAATHGVIRVGHAARALGERETASRRRELADALAAWAATWRQLPATDGPVRRTMPPRQAIGRVPIVPAERRRPGNIVAALAALGDFPPFAPVIAMVEPTGELAPEIADRTELFARVYLANAHNIPTTIAFIHAVTSHAALGNIAPFLSETTARRALRFGWQAGCALLACYGGDTRFAETVEEPAANAEALVERAIENGDEHVIKFTEACLSRHAVAPSPAYLAAADGVHRFIRRHPAQDAVRRAPAS